MFESAIYLEALVYSIPAQFQWVMDSNCNILYLASFDAGIGIKSEESRVEVTGLSVVIFLFNVPPDNIKTKSGMDECLICDNRCKPGIVGDIEFRYR